MTQPTPKPIPKPVPEPSSQHEAAVPQPAHQQIQQETQQVQDVAGVTYLEQGEGPPIVFLHGIGGAARQFAQQLAHFGRTHRAIAWDMPGYGNSVPLPLVTMAALAAALGSFLAALGLGVNGAARPVIVGHSIGGMLLQRLLVEAPHAAPGWTRAIVLAQTSAAFGSRDPAWADAFVRDRLGPLDEGHSMADLAPAMVAAMVGDDPDPAGIALAESCIAATPAPTYRDTVLAMPGFDLRADLPRIAVPTLVLAGAKDPNAPAAAMQRMAAQIPGARFETLDAVGHLAHLEHPARFNAALDAFLASLPPP